MHFWSLGWPRPEGFTAADAWRRKAVRLDPGVACASTCPSGPQGRRKLRRHAAHPLHAHWRKPGGRKGETPQRSAALCRGQTREGGTETGEWGGGGRAHLGRTVVAHGAAMREIDVVPPRHQRARPELIVRQLRRGQHRAAGQLLLEAGAPGLALHHRHVPDRGRVQARAQGQRAGCGHSSGRRVGRRWPAARERRARLGGFAAVRHLERAPVQPALLAA